VRALAAIPGIEVTGSVADVRPYYRDALMAVVPLRVGGGTRLKILEAMAAGLPVISTTLGAEGLTAVPGTHYLAADSALAMRTCILQAAQGGDSIARIAAAGRELVKRCYDWPAISGALATQLLELVAADRAAAATSA
jgi:glycosyltransferase involved in cell wall biosynthesis